MVGILPSSLTVGAELSKPFAKYHSVSVMWSCRGTLRLVTSAPRLHFAFGKALVVVTLVGRLKCSEVLPPPTPPSSTFLVFVPLPSYSYTHSPSSHLPSWHLTAPFSAVDFRSLYKNPPWLRPFSWPSLMPLWHTLRRTPHQSHLHPPFHPAIGHLFVPRHRSGVQAHTFIS